MASMCRAISCLEIKKSCYYVNRSFRKKKAVFIKTAFNLQSDMNLIPIYADWVYIITYFL